MCKLHYCGSTDLTMIENKTTIILVSLLGVKNAGGVERVSYYLKDILERNFSNVKLLERGRPSFGKFSNILWPFLLSLKLYFIKDKIVIANSWNCYLYPADFSIHHGTMRGTVVHVGAGKTAGLIAWMEKLSAKKARKILSVSENCKSELINYYKIDENKIDVLNNFVDENRFYPSTENSCSKDNSASGKKSSDKKITVLFSGALIERKGLSKLKEFSDFLETFNSEYEIELLIASNTSEEYSKFQNKKHTKICSGLGIDQMPDFYRKGDILIFPTLYEGFSMSTLEALASGLCVIGTEFAVTKELESYDFCCKYDFASPEQTAKLCIEMYNKFSDKKEYISKKTVERFGKAEYEKRIVEYINSALKNKNRENAE